MAPAVPTTHVKRMNNITPKMFWIHGKKHPMSVPVCREKTNIERTRRKAENLNFKLFSVNRIRVLDPPRNKIISNRMQSELCQRSVASLRCDNLYSSRTFDGAWKWAAYPFERRARLVWHRPQRHPVQLVSYWSNWLRIRSSTWFGGVRVSLPAGKKIRQKRVRIYAKLRFWIIHELH